MIYDVVVAGAGVIGGMVARELSKYKLSVLMLEKEYDVACGASKANSGIVHGGFDPEPDTLKAKLNVEGVEKLFETAKMLNVPCKRNGSFVCAFSEEENKAHSYEEAILTGMIDHEFTTALGLLIEEKGVYRCDGELSPHLKDKPFQEAYEWLVECVETMEPEIVTDEIIDNMAQARKALGLCYSGDASYIVTENENMGFYLPEEGTNRWYDSMVIPKTAESYELAHEFMNFITSYDMAYANSDWGYYLKG